MRFPIVTGGLSTEAQQISKRFLDAEDFLPGDEADLTKPHSVIVLSPVGTGKTTALIALVKTLGHMNVLMMNPRAQLAQTFAAQANARLAEADQFTVYSDIVARVTSKEGYLDESKAASSLLIEENAPDTKWTNWMFSGTHNPKRRRLCPIQANELNNQRLLSLCVGSVEKLACPPQHPDILRDNQVFVIDELSSTASFLASELFDANRDRVDFSLNHLVYHLKP